MTTDKRGVSALLLQRQFGLSNYETVWMMLHKLRRAMVNTSREPLHGEVEVDETWGWRRTGRFARKSATQRATRGPRPRGGRKTRQGLRACSHESDSRLQGQDHHSFPYSECLSRFDDNTDGLKSCEGLSEMGFKHSSRIQPLRSELRKGAKSAVPLADRAIGNLQQWLIGTYHGVSRGQLQVYLDEFVFRHNRRNQPAAAFQTLLGLGTARKSTEYRRIRGATDLQDKINHNF